MVVLATVGDGHRLAGGDLRRVLGHPPGRAARLPAAADHAATPRAEIGQVYVPAVNWGIFVAVVALVVGFGSSDHLAAAYGIAVTGTLAIDTMLFFVVVRALWHRPLWLALAGARVLPRRRPRRSSRANLPKVLHGGWFPLAIAAIIFTVLDDLAERARDRDQAAGASSRARCRSSSRRCATRDDVFRAPRTGVFLNANPETTPLALRANVEHNRHAARDRRDHLDRDAQRPARAARQADRASTTSATQDDGICHMTARFGFQDDIDIPRDAARRPRAGSRATSTSTRSPTSSRAITIIARRRPVHGAVAQEAVRGDRHATRRTRSSTSTCPTRGRS